MDSKGSLGSEKSSSISELEVVAQPESNKNALSKEIEKNKFSLREKYVFTNAPLIPVIPITAVNWPTPMLVGMKIKDGVYHDSISSQQ